MNDLRVTPEGMPGVEVDGVLRPLFYSVMGNKRWAEYRGATFTEIMGGGWSPGELEPDDLGRLLLIGLEGGELRRHLCAGGQGLPVDETLVERIFERYHVASIIGLVLEAWNQAPDERNPPTPPVTRSPGGVSSS